jgi:hypothetical protein
VRGKKKMKRTNELPPRQTRTTEGVLQEQKASAEKARAEARSGVSHTAMVRTAGNTLTADSANPWMEIGAELDRSNAPYLKLTHTTGEFTVSDVESVPLGTRCIAHIDELELGWLHWEGGKPSDRRVGRVAEGFVPPKRSELGDDDKQYWEDQDRDPWQFTMEVPITRLDTGERCKFTTSSGGGKECVGRLSRAYGLRLHAEERPGLPVVELRSDHYRNRYGGRTFKPIMSIVNWTGSDGKPLSVADDLQDEVPF